MESSLIIILIVIAVVAFIFFFIVTTRNNFVRLTNNYKATFAQIETELTRRYDLIPNLVETAKGYMEHERGTLTEVIEARNQASGSLDAAKSHLDDGDLMKALSEAEGALSSSLGKLMVVVEDYPELKANEQMLNLSKELSTAEDRIATLRKHYNFTIEDYNNARQVFPANLVAGMFNYEAMAWLPMEEEKREVPKVKFS